MKILYAFLLLLISSGCSSTVKDINVENTDWVQNSGFGGLRLSLMSANKASLLVFSDTAPHAYQREGVYKIQGDDLSVVFPKSTVFSTPMKLGSWNIPSEKVKLEKLEAEFKIHGFFGPESGRYLDGYAKLFYMNSNNNVIPITDGKVSNN